MRGVDWESAVEDFGRRHHYAGHVYEMTVGFDSFDVECSCGAKLHATPEVIDLTDVTLGDP